MKTLFFLFSPLLVILFVNCSNENHSTVVTQPKEVSTVLMQIKSSANGPFQSIADSAIIQISADDMLDFEKELNLDEGAITGVVEGIPAGINRKIIVKVFDSLGVVHYQGATISNLEANDTTKINLAIYRVGADLELKGTVNDSTLLNEGLVAYYTFEGDARDLSGNGHHGIVHGASLTQDRFGNADGAYAFGGNDSENWIEVPGQVLVNYPFSISFIVQSATYTEPGTASNGFVAILDSNRMDRHFAVFEQLSGGIRMSARNGLWYHEKSNLYLDDDDFHLITGVFVSENERHLYVDDEWINTSDSTINFFTANRISIGGIVDVNPSDFLEGVIDEVRIYNRTLKPEEIKELYSKMLVE